MSSLRDVVSANPLAAPAPAPPMSARELMAKVQQARQAAAPAASEADVDDRQAGVPRTSSFGGAFRSLRKKSIVMDSGFTTFKSGIKAGWHREIMSRKFRQAVAAEFFATAVFVAVGSACVVFNYIAPSTSTSTDTTPQDPIPSRTLVSFTFGFMISVLVFSTGSISGGNLNPAVTLSLFVTRKMSWLRMIAYIAAQCLGATVGASFIRSLSPDQFHSSGGAVNEVKSGWTLWTAIGGEMLGTGLLVFTVCSAADVGREKNNKYTGALTPLVIGIAVLCAHFFLIPIDGCSINPARSFGSSVAFGDVSAWDNHWVFWVGPLCGGPLVALVYEYVFKAKDEPSPSGGGGPDDRGLERTSSMDSLSSSFTATGNAPRPTPRGSDERAGGAKRPMTTSEFMMSVLNRRNSMNAGGGPSSAAAGALPPLASPGFAAASSQQLLTARSSPGGGPQQSSIVVAASTDLDRLAPASPLHAHGRTTLAASEWR